MIAIVDYGIGNLASVSNAFKKIDIPVKISGDKKIISMSKAIVLPGVGAAGEGMKNLRQRKLDSLLKELVIKGRPVLGICLGMQLLLSYSQEGETVCLNLIKGRVKKFKTALKIPEIGWNQVNKIRNSKLLNGIDDGGFFYFINSYYCQPEDREVVTGLTDYDQQFCSILEYRNIFGVQFHPEKSGIKGLQLLINFANLRC